MAEKTEKKLTGLQMPLNISPELAKIIGTKKGEQVCIGLSGVPFHMGTFCRCLGPKLSRSCGRTSRRRTCRYLISSARNSSTMYSTTNSQDPENKQFFTPDKTMEGIFGDKRQKCFGMSKHG